VVSKLDSQLGGRGFETHPILDGNGVKAIPGSIPEPYRVHTKIKKKENVGSQMRHTKKYFLKDCVLQSKIFKVVTLLVNLSFNGNT